MVRSLASSSLRRNSFTSASGPSVIAASVPGVAMVEFCQPSAPQTRIAQASSAEKLRPFVFIKSPSRSSRLDGAELRLHTKLLLHRNHRDPLPVHFVAISNRSTQTLRNVLGQQVAMVAEKLFFHALPKFPILQQRMRGLVLRGEDQGHVKLRASRDRGVDLRDGEVLDAQHAERLTDIAQPRPRNFIRRRPRRQNARPRISQRQKTT